MKKKILIVLLFSTALVFSIININLMHNDIESTETLFSINRADASFGEWWDREDYNCESVPCSMFSTSEVCIYAGNGAGSSAHCWSCIDC